MIRLLVLLSLLVPAHAQREISGSAQLRQSLRKLNTLGSVLMIAAHPDDENTSLLAYYARGRLVRTAYLSLTRGEGGQNLIGSEQGDYMGVIRTQELMAARRIDGAEQLFTRATDFGYSKTASESIAKWGHEPVLSDIVWVIRTYRPDVILSRWSGTSLDGHGQHQASGILAKEAFAAAADPAKFPEQLQLVKPWQAKRLVYNILDYTPEHQRVLKNTPNKLIVDPGEYNPLLGYSYAEIAGMSRSQHQSQGMGWAEQRGSMKDHLTVIAGESATSDPLDGVDTSWSRLPGGAAVSRILSDADKAFDPMQPQGIVPSLVKVRPLIAAIDQPEAKRKLRDLDEMLANCAGLWVDAAAERFAVTPGSSVRIDLTAVNRLPAQVTLREVRFTGLGGATAVDGKDRMLAYNEPLKERTEWKVPETSPLTQPFWLVNPKQGTLYGVSEQKLIGNPENAPVLTAHFRFRISGTDFTVDRPVHFRYVDKVHGELTRPLIVVPPVSVEIAEAAAVFPDNSSKTVDVLVKANQAGASGNARLQAPADWKIEPAEQPFQLASNGEQTTLRFQVTPPAGDAIAQLRATAVMTSREYGNTMRIIAYTHIPPQAVFPEAKAKLVRAGIRTLSKSVGYIMGSGDEIPESLRQIGIQVSLLTDEDIAGADLLKFDAVLTGVRAFNTRPALRANFQRLLDFASKGGTLVVQYNVLEGFPGRESPESTSQLGPYPLKLGRDRITVEDSPVTFPNPAHRLLATPNTITAKDFDGWVQERGLYFAKEYDAKYESVFSSQDPGEDWLPGGMLYTRYGKGAYVFSAYSWFRQLPAGVPGAYRIFANLLSAGKASQ